MPRTDHRLVRAVLVVSCGVLLLPPGCVSTNQRPIGSASAARQQELRRLATIGLVFGAIETEAALERAVERQLRELRATTTTAGEGARQRLASVLERGQLALALLDRGLELAAAPQPLPSSGDYRRELRKRSQSAPKTIRLTVRSDGGSTVAPPPVAAIERQVEERLAHQRHQLAARIRRTVQHLSGAGPVTASRLDIATVQRLLAQAGPVATTVRRFPDLLQGGLQHHIERLFRRRQDVESVASATTERSGGGEGMEKKKEMKKKKEKQQQEQNELAISVEGVASGEEQESSAASSSEEDDEDGPGGLVGLIASLSGGGDEGSDVGALIGTLSGLITNLFGPGGLDIPGLLGTGTSLIAGLLGGDDNFGKVLGSYVGIAIEGLSGGGADMNGAFFGNFLGALLAALSSDPEDESLPLRPKLFVENFFSGLQEAKRKDDPQEGGGGGGDQHHGGSDLFGFITHVVSSVVGGITSLVLNASLGSSGGSSQGSVDASGASSSGSSGGGGTQDHH